MQYDSVISCLNQAQKDESHGEKQILHRRGDVMYRDGSSKMRHDYVAVGENNG